jgi:hypothetical protein
VSLDHYLSRIYDRQSRNCLHLLCDAWLEVTGEDLTERLAGVLEGVTRAHVKAFEWLSRPADPCIVLMRNPGIAGDEHVGMMIGGLVLHHQRSGVTYQPLDVASIGYSDVRFCR